MVTIDTAMRHHLHPRRKSVLCRINWITGNYSLTGGPWGTCDHTETALTLCLTASCLAAAWRSAVRDEASILMCVWM
jgi:hypothetical protein